MTEQAVATPRTTYGLIGHEEAEATLLRAIASGRMPHAWLIAGPRGVGKATLAFRLARFLLAHGADVDAAAPLQSLAVDPETTAARRIAAGSHPGLLAIERPFLNDKNTETQDLNIHQARRVGPFLHKTAADGDWRVVIVDEADALNVNSANAVLKIIEEPPDRTLVMLLAERPGALLPTIRSRCRRLTLNPLSEDGLADTLRADDPRLGPADAIALARLSDGCLGRALRLKAAGGLDLQAGVDGVFADLPGLDLSAVHGLADAVAAKGAEERFDLLRGIVETRLADAARAAALQGGRHGLERWFPVWEKTRALFARAIAANLDRKQVVIQVFEEIRLASRG